MTGRIKRQHFVPQGYLRRFQSDNSTSKVARIWVVDRHNEKPFNVPIQTVASREGFYDSRLDDGIKDFEKHGLENLLRIEEDKFYASLRKLDESILENRTIPEDVKPGISWYLYLQFIRTAKFRSGLSIPEGETRPDYQKLTQAYGFIDKKLATKFISVCISSIWVVYEMVGRQTAFTSDNPVVFTFEDPESSLSLAMRNDDIVFKPSMGMRIMFPIDSKHVLFLYDREFAPEKAVFENKVVDFDSAEAYSLWMTQIRSCDRHIFLSSNDSMCQVIKMIMQLDSVLDPISEVLGGAIDYVRSANTSISNTKLNSYRGYLDRKEITPLFEALKQLGKTNDS